MANAIEQMHRRAKPLAICADADFSNFNLAGIRGSLPSTAWPLVVAFDADAMPLAGKGSFLGAMISRHSALHRILS